jgi:hypothetical protein
MGRAKPKPNANTKAASPTVLPPTVTRKWAQVPNENEPNKCKALKGALDEEEHGPYVLKGALEEEDKPDEVVDKEVGEEEDDGAVEAFKEAEGVAVRDDSKYPQPIGILAIMYTLVFTNNYFNLTFFLVERLSLTHFFVERTTFVFVERLFCWTSLFVECSYKVTNATQEVENNDKVENEKVEEEPKIALVEVQVETEITEREEVGFNEKVDDNKDVEEETEKVSLQQARHQEIAATKKSLRL